MASSKPLTLPLCSSVVGTLDINFVCLKSAQTVWFIYIVSIEVLPKIRTGMLASPERKESRYVQKKESRPGIQSQGGFGRPHRK